MQQQMMRHEDISEELNEVKAQLGSTERERDRALNELKEIKRQMNNAEVNSFKERFRNAEKELQVKDNVIKSLKSEVDKFKQLELKFREKEASLQNVKDEAKNFESSLVQTEGLLSETKKNADKLAVEMDRMKESEAKLSESCAAQTSQIEESTLFLEKSRVQIASLEEKMRDLVKENERKQEEIERLQTEVLICKGNVIQSESLDTIKMLDEIDILRDELKQAMEAEDASKRALDDLAVALQEVATESNQAKEKITLAEQQLQEAKNEAASLKMMLKSNEEKYRTFMKDSEKENERLNNTVNRLRLEAEESLLAFNEREVEFVKCIKSTEEEKSSVQKEFSRLMKSLREAGETTEKAKDDNKKLRDILKHALNEANLAKKNASLAQEEISYLKESLAEKDKALVTLAQETERLRITEAEANESIKEMKRVMSSGNKKEAEKLERENKEQKKEKEHSRELKKGTKRVNAVEKSEKEHKENRLLSNPFGFDLNQLWPSSMTTKSNKDFDEDLDEDNTPGGSTLDPVNSSVKEVSNDHLRNSSACSSEDNLNFDQFDENAHSDDMENDKTSQGNKRKALLRRFGDLLRRKNTHPSKDLPHSPKEVAHSPKEIPA